MLFPEFSLLPAPLRESALTQWRRFQEVGGSALPEQPLAGQPLSACLLRLFAGSDYALSILLRQPHWLDELLAEGALTAVRAPAFWAAAEAALLADAPDEAVLMTRLRLLRQREMLRLIFRDLNRLCTLSELTGELSRLAETCLAAALAHAHAAVASEVGEPIGEESGRPQRLVVIGMGKLGASELNLSSDIDLIFCYPEAGETTGPRRISNQEFFIRVGQRLIRLLDANTGDGFVFRVDMRLRPWGEGAALVSSFAAMETYYERHGREWERYALIKARVVAGDAAEGELLLRSLRPFVYRRYIDFGVFESLRDMKAMIAREIRRKGMDADVKLGAGGIREIEFIAQAFQLIRGGVDPRLQQREVALVLPLLAEAGLLPATTVEDLRAAYLFLRDVEHRLQAWQDRQTQSLPDDVEQKLRLAFAMGYADWATFAHALGEHRNWVQTCFNDVIVAREDGEAVPALLAAATLVWRGEHEAAHLWLAEQGFSDAELAANALRLLRASRIAQTLQREGRERLDRLMPRLLSACVRTAEPDLALARTMPLVESVLRRSAYMMLLVENPSALEQLVSLCVASPWIAEELARYPVLLDELLNAETLYAPPQKAELQAELRQVLLRVPPDDLEQQMEELRIFQKGEVLRVAASDLKGTLPLMKISDYLTWIAEAMLEEVLNLCWQSLVSRHGRPRRRDGSPCERDFIIVGYGKLGGIELGYGSDLDLVFIHDADPEAETDGDRPLEGATFFARLGQKIVHMLTTATPAGQLYEVDMRLRPSGAAGLLVSSLTAFGNYQYEHAWTWEHQALVRARVVAGDSRLAEAFEAVRQKVLGRARELAALRQEVLTMRDKMRNHLGSEAQPGREGEVFALKHDRGGIVDIEFMVQYGVLAWAHTHPELCRYTDNVRILEGFAALGLMRPEDADALRATYLAYRARGHRLALANREAKVKESEFIAERATVCRLWQSLFGTE